MRRKRKSEMIMIAIITFFSCLDGVMKKKEEGRAKEIFSRKEKNFFCFLVNVRPTPLVDFFFPLASPMSRHLSAPKLPMTGCAVVSLVGSLEVWSWSERKPPGFAGQHLFFPRFLSLHPAQAPVPNKLGFGGQARESLITPHHRMPTNTRERRRPQSESNARRQTLSAKSRGRSSVAAAEPPLEGGL